MPVLRVLFLLLASAVLAAAQDTPAPSPSAAPTPVPIHFLPPPLEGTISLGIYDASGKLVRVLQREAEVEEFEMGSDALGTVWDGKDDRGETLPPGKYHARGYAVGDIDVDGIGFFFNDWISEDQTLRIKKMDAITVENGAFLLTVQLSGNEAATLVLDGNAEIITTGTARTWPAGCQPGETPELIDPIACAPGKDGTHWIIDRIAPGAPETEVKQFSAEKELLRRLAIPAPDPQPRTIAASQDTETIFLLEENNPGQRLRSLTLLATKSDQGQSISDWKIDFEKAITAHKDFAIANGQPVVSGGTVPAEKIMVKLPPNPLRGNERETVDLTVASDDDGSFLQTTDGLPLQSISETPHLTRIVLAPTSKTAADVFQDDDAVVEQFHLTGLDRMMAFDCGEIELK